MTDLISVVAFLAISFGLLWVFRHFDDGDYPGSK